MQTIIFFVAIYLVLQMTFVWLLYRITKNPSIVDVTWSLGLIVSGLIYLFNQPINFRLLIIAGLLLAWGLRLAGYLWYTRIRFGHVDKRYQQLSDGWKMAKSAGFFLNFQLQGLLIFIISIVFLFAANGSINNLSIIDWLGVLLVIVGIFGETIADLQLKYFKQNHAGQVCKVGLWKFSRHPNYFFDWLVWCGFMCFAWQSQYWFFALISPLTLFIIFTKITGPITERGSIKAKGQAYLSYQEQTNMFFPWFRRKISAR